MTETRLVRACLDLLAANGIFCWRNNTGAFAGEYRGRRRFVRFGAPGSADILGVIPATVGRRRVGLALAVECKVGRNKLSPQQERWGREFIAAGGVYLLQRDDTDGLMEAVTMAEWMAPRGVVNNTIKTNTAFDPIAESTP